MKDAIFVNAEDMKTLEQYAASLLFGMATLKTLDAYHVQAFKLGLFDTDEEEASKTILWEIQRLLSLYKTQLEKVIERTGFDQDEAIKEFRKVMPGVSIPRKKKAKDGKGASKSNNV